MTQPFPGFCPRCNNPVQAGQRFCHECGASLSQDANASTSRPDSTVVKQNGASAPSWVPMQDVMAGGSPAPASGYPFPLSQAQENLIPPPPPPSSLFPPILSSPYEGASAPGFPGATTTPATTKSSGKGRASAPAAPKRSRRGMIPAILLFVLVLGSIGIWFAFFRPHGTSTGNQRGNSPNGQGTLTTGSTPNGNSNTPDSTNANTSSGSNNTPSTNGSPVSSGAVTEQVNLKFTYASIVYAVTSVQQANSFPDDSGATQSLVRINLNENNPTSNNPGFAYDNAAHLLLPDGTITPVANSQYRYAPDAATQHANWLDFAIPSPNLDLSKLVLRMGQATESQMDIPLMPNADLSKYQPKTITPNTAFQYAGLHFTITTVAKSLSADTQQAATGQIFIVVTMKVVNSTSNEFFDPAGNYMRLKSGDTTSPPTDNSYSTFPRDFASQSTG